MVFHVFALFEYFCIYDFWMYTRQVYIYVRKIRKHHIILLHFTVRSITYLAYLALILKYVIYIYGNIYNKGNQREYISYRTNVLVINYSKTTVVS